MIDEFDDKVSLEEQIVLLRSKVRALTIARDDHFRNAKRLSTLLVAEREKNISKNTTTPKVDQKTPHEWYSYTQGLRDLGVRDGISPAVCGVLNDTADIIDNLSLKLLKYES